MIIIILSFLVIYTSSKYINKPEYSYMKKYGWLYLFFYFFIKFYLLIIYFKKDKL